MNISSKLCLIAMSLMTTSLAFATVESSTHATTCYIMKNNKVTKKAPCSYEQDEGPDFLYQTFTTKGLGAFQVDFEGSKRKLNGKPAQSKYRDSKTHKFMSVDDSFKVNHLTCLTSKATEFCYFVKVE